MTESFEAYRPLLFSIAYRMLGSVMEAEDMVQEAYLRYRATPPESIQSEKSFLTTVVTRLCLDQLKSARVQRETYIGPWLPEPLLTDGASLLSSPMNYVSAQESISMAFLVLLESLTPLERAVFLLREVFDYEYAEIAKIVDKEEAACRQLFSRAKKHIANNRPRFKSTPEEHRQMLDSFMHAIADGELEGLMNLLAEDVGWWSDGGGKVTAATRPVHGREAVARLIFALQRFAPENVVTEIAEVNGRPALIFRVEGKVTGVLAFDVSDNLIRQFRFVVNPDKLKHL